MDSTTGPDRVDGESAAQRPEPAPPTAPARSGLTRRAVLSGAALLGVGAGVDRALGGALSSGGSTGSASAPAMDAVVFHGAHQAGIATPPQGYLHFAAFDITTESKAALRDLFQRWTAAAAALTAGRQYQPHSRARGGIAVDGGEAVDLAPAQLTLTFGFGPSLFSSQGRDRFGLARLQPPALRVLPAFPGEQLDPGHSDGDVCVQACANDPQVAFHAFHVLFGLAGADAALRWAQLGFRRASSATGSQQTPRNLLGFKDGTNNIRSRDTAALKKFVWVARNDGPRWLSGGTYLVARRIQTMFEVWDAMGLSEQESTIGRHKSSGAPLGARREHDAVDLQARAANGDPVIPLDAHVRVASPQTNGGQRILRRGYSYSAGATPGPPDRGGQQIDAGLFFIAFVRDPNRQFIPLQRHVARNDALTEFTVHTASAIFACPPGASRGGYIGQGLLA